MPGPENEDEQPGTRYEIVFTASGCVCKGDGADALEVPDKRDES